MLFNENLKINKILLIIFISLPFFISSNQIHNINDIIILPLKIFQIPDNKYQIEKSKDPLSLIINKIISNNLYLDLKINHEIECPGYLTFNSPYNYFGIDSCIELHNNIEYIINSTTEKLSGINLFLNEYQNFYYSKENITMPTINKSKDKFVIEDMGLILPEDNQRKMKCLILGLNPNLNNKTNENINIKLLNLPLNIKGNKHKNFKLYLTFFYNYFLKNNKIKINDLEQYLQYNEKRELLIIGEAPHIIYPNTFRRKNYKEIDNHYMTKDDYNYYSKSSEQNPWSIKIDTIYFNNVREGIKNYIGIFSIDYAPFLFPMELFNDYVDIYIKFYIEKRICFRKGRPLSRKYTHTLHDDKRQTFIFIYCEKNKIENLTEFYDSIPSLKFHNDLLNKTFEFSGKELLYEENEYIFLMIMPDLFKNMKITLGKIFMEKYLFTFNYDNNSIGFYDWEFKNIETNNIFINNFFLIFYKNFIFIIVFGVIVVLINISNKKKKKLDINKDKNNEDTEEELIDF